MTSFEKNTSNVNQVLPNPSAGNPNLTQDPNHNKKPSSPRVKKEYSEDSNEDKKNRYHNDITNPPGGFNTIDSD